MTDLQPDIPPTDDQLYLAKELEPPPDPVRTPELDKVVFAWLDAKEAQRKAAQATKDAHLVLMYKLEEAKIEKYPYVDKWTGYKGYVTVKTTRKASTAKAPKAKRAAKVGRERKPKTPMSEQVESRRVPRETVEHEIDPFASTRVMMVEAHAGEDVDMTKDELDEKIQELNERHGKRAKAKKGKGK